MNSLKNNKDLLFSIKEQIMNNDNSIITSVIIDNNSITSETISIVMTSSNRSKQTYFTLDTIKKSAYKDIQVIIVDDSTNDPIKREVLERYPFYIDFITINKINKRWHNPLVNYNIGFTYIKGSKIIIQNAEVCHIGDVVSNVYNNTFDNNYYVFDVKAVKDYDSNDKIYRMNTDNISIYENEELFSVWYQHETNNRNLHFLTAMTINTFSLINSFSYDYIFGTCYDDDDFLLKIKSNKINIINFFNNNCGLGGIHLFHGISTETWDINRESNQLLFEKKINYYNNHHEYIDVSEDNINFDLKYYKLN